MIKLIPINKMISDDLDWKAWDKVTDMYFGVSEIWNFFNTSMYFGALNDAVFYHLEDEISP